MGESVLQWGRPGGNPCSPEWTLLELFLTWPGDDTLGRLPVTALVALAWAASVPTSSLPVGFEKSCGVRASHKLSCPSLTG